MPKTDKQKKYTKSDLPLKICAVCNRQFAWRKRWEKVWNEVKYCSERCRKNKKADGNKEILPSAF